MSFLNLPETCNYLFHINFLVDPPPLDASISAADSETLSPPPTEELDEDEEEVEEDEEEDIEEEDSPPKPSTSSEERIKHTR